MKVRKINLLFQSLKMEDLKKAPLHHETDLLLTPYMDEEACRTNIKNPTS